MGLRSPAQEPRIKLTTKYALALCIAGAEQLGSQAAASAAQIHAIALYDEGGQALQQGTLLLCVVLLGHR